MRSPINIIIISILKINISFDITWKVITLLKPVQNMPIRILQNTPNYRATKKLSA